MPLVRWALRCINYSNSLGWGDKCLFVFKFPFVWDKICEVFDDVLMDICHEGFDGWFWDFKVGSLLMKCLCMAPLTLAMMVMRGLVSIHCFV